MSCDSTTQPEQKPEQSDAPVPRETMQTRIFVDTHVHLYRRYDVVRFFDQAKANFDRCAATTGGELPAVGCLMLSETASDDAFEMLLKLQDGGECGWSFRACGDGLSLWAEQGADRILVVAGCQVITDERLEVLALGTRQRIDDGLDINQTIQAVQATGAQAVLPYGLGKWTGRRAEIATKAFYKWHEHGLRLGDNAGRPRGLPDNGLFHCARKMDTPIFPGSDPLNTPSGERLAGSYGVVIETEFSKDSPAKEVLRSLAEMPAAPTTFGKRVGMSGCFLQQFALRWHKRKNKRQ